jgi:hypothetical protein
MRDDPFRLKSSSNYVGRGKPAAICTDAFSSARYRKSRDQELVHVFLRTASLDAPGRPARAATARCKGAQRDHETQSQEYRHGTDTVPARVNGALFRWRVRAVVELSEGLLGHMLGRWGGRGVRAVCGLHGAIPAAHALTLHELVGQSTRMLLRLKHITRGPLDSTLTCGELSVELANVVAGLYRRGHCGRQMPQNIATGSFQRALGANGAPLDR